MQHSLPQTPVVCVLCRDGVTVHLPPHAVRQCATLAHMLGDCSGQDNMAEIPPVPLHSAAVLRLCSLVDHAAEVATWDTDDLLDVARAADFLAHEDALLTVCAELGNRLAADTTILDGWDLPCHLLCLVAHRLQLEALCQLVLRRVDLGDVLKPRMLTLAKDVALRFAAKAGWLNTCRWLAETFHLTPDDARVVDNYALRWACENGHLDVCRWLTETFELTADDARADNNYALSVAAGNGHLDVCQWLTETFHLTADDARADNNYALSVATKNGHLAVCRWLTETFHLQLP